jgi:hypothetical protein
MANSSETILLDDCRTWLANSDVWAGWTGHAKGSAEIRSTIVWPLKAAATMPLAVLSLRGSQRINRAASCSGGNWRPSGSLSLAIYAADTDPDDPETGYTAFADLFFQLMDELATENDGQTVPLVYSFDIADPPIVHSSWVNSDADTAAWYQGFAIVNWGYQTQ